MVSRIKGTESLLKEVQQKLDAVGRSLPDVNPDAYEREQAARTELKAEKKRLTELLTALNKQAAGLDPI